MSENIITIYKLKSFFLSEVTENGKYVEFSDAGDFTDKVYEAMKKLGEACSVQFSPEYYGVDYTFWEKANEQKQNIPETCGMNKNSNWNLLALVEHENNSNDWHYEVQKLAPFRCPLRVVIGYRSKRHSDEERLGRVVELLQIMKMNQCFCDEGEFWVVIGNTGHETADYVFYRYNASKEKFEKEDL